MLIGGFMKQSFIDFPQTLSSIIFTNGCNLNCWYCHNRQLINGNSQENYSIEKIYEFLESRKNFIEGVVISGGEPTIQPDLESVIDKIKSLNLKVKLDTNGTNPKVLKHLMTTNKIDYVAMDVKNSLKNYDKIICLNIDQDKIKNLIDNIKESVETLLNQDVIDYEFRTTFSPDISLEDIEEIGTGGSSTLVVASVADLTGEDMPDNLVVGQTAFVTGESKSYILTALGDAPPSSYVWTEMTSSDTVWSGTENSVIFYALTQSAYDGISPKNADTLYFVTDSGKIFKGDTALTDSVIVTGTIPEVASAIKNKLYINPTTLESKITTDGVSWINMSPGYLTDGANWAEADGNKLATIALIKEGINSSITTLLGAGAADVVITSTAAGGIQRTTKTLGGATLQGEPTENVLATEVAVKTAIDNAISWTDIPSV